MPLYFYVPVETCFDTMQTCFENTEHLQQYLGMADERICPPVTTQAHPAGLVHVTPNNSPPVQKVFTITFKTF